MAFLSYFFGAVSLLLTADRLGPDLFGALPWFAPAAAAVTGFFIGLIWYFDIKDRERAAKKRAKALAAMLFNTISCILAVLYYIYQMLNLLG